MSDDEADPELLALLAQSLGLGTKPTGPPKTGVLESVKYVYDNAIDVSISSAGTKAAATKLHEQLQQRQYSTYDWAKHELHPKPADGAATVNFIFTMNLLNFSFWSDLPEDERFAVEYKGKRWTGYWSLVAALRRGVEEGQSFHFYHPILLDQQTETNASSLLTGKCSFTGYPITTPSSWSTISDDEYAHVFRSATSEPMPLLEDRVQLLRTASHLNPMDLIDGVDYSAAQLVNNLTSQLPDHFSDSAHFENRNVSFHKRAQILVADLWACARGESFGRFDDIDTALTMFADYRVPQMLQRLGILRYSPRLESKIRRKEVFQSGEKMEVELRGCSVWAVELLKREIVRKGGVSWEVEVDDVEMKTASTPQHAHEQPDSNGNDTISDAASHPQVDAILPGSPHLDSTVATTGEWQTTTSTHAVHGRNTATTGQSSTEASSLPATDPEAAAASAAIGPQHLSPPTSTNYQASDSVPVDQASSSPSDTPATNVPSADPPASSIPPAAPSATSAPSTNPLAPSIPPNQSPAPTEPRPVPRKRKITVHLNAILLDYLLYDTAKELEAAELAAAQADAEAGNTHDPDGPKTLPHHRCRSIWY